MSQRERDRLKVLPLVVDGKRTGVEADGGDVHGQEQHLLGPGGGEGAAQDAVCAGIEGVWDQVDPRPQPPGQGPGGAVQRHGPGSAGQGATSGRRDDNGGPGPARCLPRRPCNRWHEQGTKTAKPPPHEPALEHGNQGFSHQWHTPRMSPVTVAKRARRNLDRSTSRGTIHMIHLPRGRLRLGGPPRFAHGCCRVLLRSGRELAR